MKTSSLFSTLAIVDTRHLSKSDPSGFVRYDFIDDKNGGQVEIRAAYINDDILPDFILANEGKGPTAEQIVNVVIDQDTGEVTVMRPVLPELTYGTVHRHKIGLHDFATARHIRREGGDPSLFVKLNDAQGTNGPCVSLMAAKAFRKFHGQPLRPGTQVAFAIIPGGPHQCALATHIRPV